jgi:hypothetical protein
MSPSGNSFPKTVGAILYGLIAGLAATVVIVLGCMFLGLLVGWASSSLGWKQLGYAATVAGFSSVYFTVVIGLIVGIIVCYKVSTTCLRQQSARPKPIL